LKNIEEITDLSKSLAIIDNIRKIGTGKISSVDFPNYEIQINSICKGVCFTLTHNTPFFKHENWEFKDLVIEKNELKVKVPNLFINEKTGGVAKGKIPSIEYGQFDQNQSSYHRLALPVSIKLNFIFSVKNVLIDYKYESVIQTREAIEIKLGNRKFRLFSAKKNITKKSDRDYLIIECNNPLTYNDFAEYCFSILISFGYLSGDFINDDGYFLQYKENNMTEVIGLAYRQMRGTIKCDYVPTYSNPYSYIHNKKISDLYEKKVRVVSSEEFSSLCELCYKNSDIRTILLLLIEVHTQSMASGPAILSVALETISKLIYEEHQETLAPIKDKQVSRKLRKSLLSELEKFRDEIGEEGIKITTKRINQINQITNREKLLSPFKILDIPITSKDIEAIEQRNAFLHGRTPMVKDIDENLSDEDKVGFYLYLKLYVLISSIILKYIGYNNLVVNYPKIYEDETGVILDEEYYRQI
jgi:hypothetical protein